MKHTIKKLLAALLCAVMLLSVLPATASAAETQGTCGENLAWVFDQATGTLTISGTGPMENYEANSGPWRIYNSKIKTIVLKEGVTTIGNSAFDYSDVAKVELPNTLISIGEYAFYSCNELTEITLPDSVETVGRYAFLYSDISKITIGSGLKNLDPTVLDLYYLKSFVVSENNPYFSLDSKGVLYNKDKTKLVRYPTKLSLSSYVVPDSVVELGAYAFVDVRLQSLTLPSSLEVIGASCFHYFYGPDTMILPAKLRLLGEGALKSIHVDEIWIDSSNPYFYTDDVGVLFNKDRTLLIQYPGDRIGSYSVPSSVTEIAPAAFDNSNITSVIIPEGIKEIKDDTFSSCRRLTSVTLPGSLESIGDYAFSNCQKMTVADLPSSLTHIGKYAFQACYALEKIAIPASIKSIGEFAFATCISVTSITLPKTLETLLDCVFSGCESITSIELPVGLKTIGSNAFNDCMGLEEITVPNTVTFIDSYAFGDCENLVHITLPGSITDLGRNAFSNCKRLKHVVYTGTKEQWTSMKTKLYESSLTRYASTIHYNAKGTEAHWITTGSNTYLYCDLCEKALIGTASETPFADVAVNMYYYEPVVWAVENNITTGTSATTFAPDKDCTRGQIVTFLWRAYGSPEPKSTTHNFTDISSSAYYYKAVLWAVEEGITTGMNATTFAPDKSCTRAQAVTFLWRAQGNPTPSTTANPFKDVAQSDYFYSPVLWASENGITTGTSATTFAPDKTCTRAQIVTFLYRAVAEK